MSSSYSTGLWISLCNNIVKFLMCGLPIRLGKPGRFKLLEVIFSTQTRAHCRAGNQSNIYTRTLGLGISGLSINLYLCRPLRYPDIKFKFSHQISKSSVEDYRILTKKFRPLDIKKVKNKNEKKVSTSVYQKS